MGGGDGLSMVGEKGVQERAHGGGENDILGTEAAAIFEIAKVEGIISR